MLFDRSFIIYYLLIKFKLKERVCVSMRERERETEGQTDGRTDGQTDKNRET